MRPHDIKRIAAALACLMLVACGVSTSPTPDPPMPTPSVRDSIALYMPTTPVAPDPLFPKNPQEQQAMSLVFDNLIDLKEDRSVAPSLCRSYTVTHDGQQSILTLTLREDVTFHAHPEAKLTAKDVVFTLEKIKGSDSPYATMLVSMHAVTEVDANTVRIVVNSNLHTFIRALCLPIVSQMLYEQTPLPCGTGAYRITSFLPTQGLVMARNENWWQGQAPYAFANVLPIEGQATALTSFAAGAIDAMTSDLRRANGLVGAHNMMRQLPLPQFSCLVPNFADPIVGRRAVRAAVNVALSRERIVTRIYVGRGRAALMPYAPLDELYDIACEPPQPNLATAQQLLIDDGWVRQEDGTWKRDGVPLAFTIGVVDELNHPERAEAAQDIADQLAQIGIQVTVNHLTAAQYAAIQAKERDFQMIYADIGLTNTCELDFLLNPSGRANFYGYNSEAMLTALRAFRNSQDLAQAKAAVRDIAAAYATDVPLIGILTHAQTLVYRSDLTWLAQPYGEFWPQLLGKK